MARSIGKVLQTERERAQLSQAQLAAGAKLAANHVARIERGEKAFPRFDTIAKLAAELDISLDWLAAECGLAPARSSARPSVRRALSALERAQQDVEATQSSLEDAAAVLRSAMGRKASS